MRNSILVLSIALTVVSVSALAAGPEYPGREWRSMEPKAAGLDKSGLDAMARAAGGRGCVVRHGCMVYAWGDPARGGDVASAAKPLYSHFLFKAVEDGRIESLDEPLSKWQPGLKELNPDLGHKDREITWRHAANQTSCYGVLERPGQAYDYNDWQMALLFDTLFLEVYSATFETVDEKVLHPTLTDILQCQDDPTFNAFGTKDRPGRAGISPRDFARFGLLYLHEGRWRDKQLISKKHARMAVTSPLPNSIPRSRSTEPDQAAGMLPDQRSIGSRRIPDNQTDHMGSYSWLWWTNGVDREGKRHWPDVPTDAYGAFGHGGKRAMVVLPSLDLIISWNDTRIEGREAENRVLGLLVKAVQSEK